MDFEIVGVQGWQLRQLQQQNVTSVVIHKGSDFDKNLFAAALKSTCQALGVSNFEYQIWSQAEWQEALQTSARQLFPRSYQARSQDFDQLVKDYNLEMPLRDWLFVEHFRYLPLLARRRKMNETCQELLRFELTYRLLEIRDFGSLKGEVGTLKLNPSWHLFDNRRGELGLSEKQIYIMAVRPDSLQVEYQPLSEEGAQVIEVLSEGIRLDVPALLRFDSSPAWQSSVQSLLAAGIILSDFSVSQGRDLGSGDFKG